MKNQFPQFRPNEKTLNAERRRADQLTQEQKMQNIWAFVKEMLAEKDREFASLIANLRRDLMTEIQGIIAEPIRQPKDGYTPIKGIDYFDGKPGEPGKAPVKNVDYFDGAPGYTPQKNKDYFDGAKGDPGHSPILNVDYFLPELPSVEQIAEELMPRIEHIYLEYLKRIERIVNGQLYLHGGGSSSSTGGSTLSPETPGGDVDGSNVTYTVTHEPVYIVVDGTIRIPVSDLTEIGGNGYTYSAGTIVVSSDAPPLRFIRAYYNA